MHRTAWVFRIFFGLLLATTAVGKLLDNRGFAEVVAQYQFFIPNLVLLPLALSVSMGELVMAVSIFVGYRLRLMAQLTILVHLGYTALATITILRGIELQNCGCFGVFLARELGWATVLEDAILTLLSVGFLIVVARSESPTRAREREDVEEREGAGETASASGL